MNRSELVDKVASTASLEKRHAEAAVAAFVDSVINESKAGNKVSIFGFGTFTPKHQEGRPGRNPRTGATVKIAPRNVVKFTAATAFKEALNARSAKKSTAKKAAPANSTVAKSTKAASKTPATAAKAPAKAAAKAPAKAAAKAPAKAATKTTSAGKSAAATKAPAKAAAKTTSAGKSAKSTTKATPAKATKSTKSARK